MKLPTKRKMRATPWVIIFGLGLGVLCGVLLSAGFSFGSEDSARFVGAFMGSVFAVSGAIALHYLREFEVRRKRDDHLRALLFQASSFVQITIKQLESDDVHSRVTVSTRRQIERLLRFVERYEFEEIAISQARLHLSLLVPDLLDIDEGLMHEGEYIKVKLEALKLFEKIIDEAADAFEGYKNLAKGQA